MNMLQKPWGNTPGKREDILKRQGHVSFPFDYQVIDPMDPKKLEFSQESHAGRRKSPEAGASQKRNLSPRKLFSHSSAKLSDHGAGETGAEIVMG